MVDGFHGLGHDAVVRCHHQDGDVSDHGAAGTHGGKGFVAGGVQEGDHLILHLHLVCTDGLGDAACFAGGDVAGTDIVQQGGLAVVDVTHDHDDGGAILQVFCLVLCGVDELFFDGHDHFLLHLAAQFHGHQSGGIVVDDVGHGGHDAHLHQVLDDHRAGLLHAAGQLAHGDLIGDLHLDRCLPGGFLLEAAHLLCLFLLTALGGLLTGTLLLAALGVDLLLAMLHLFHAVRGQLIQVGVIPIQVHVHAAAGVDHLLLGHPAAVLGGGRSLLLQGSGGSGLVGTLLSGSAAVVVVLGSLFAGSLVTLLGTVAAVALGLAIPCGLLLILSLGSGLLALALAALGLMIRFFEHFFQILNLIILSQVVKNDGQFLVTEDCHMAGRGLPILGQDLHDLLGANGLAIDLKILGYLVYSVFVIAQISHLHRSHGKHEALSPHVSRLPEQSGGGGCVSLLLLVHPRSHDFFRVRGFSFFRR